MHPNSLLNDDMLAADVARENADDSVSWAVETSFAKPSEWWVHGK